MSLPWPSWLPRLIWEPPPPFPHQSSWLPRLTFAPPPPFPHQWRWMCRINRQRYISSFSFELHTVAEEGDSLLLRYHPPEFYSRYDQFIATSDRELLVTGRFSDLIVRCNNGEELYLHKAIMCSRSHFFMGACRSGLLESHSNVINLPNDDPVMVKALIEYLYGYNYARAEWRTESAFSYVHGTQFAKALLFHTNMYAIAGLYIVPQLQAEASQCFIRILFLGCTPTKYYDFISEVVPAVYATTPEVDRGLRRIVVLFARYRYPKFTSGRHKESFELLKDQVPDFEQDLRNAMSKSSLLGYEQSVKLPIGICNDCGTVVDDETHVNRLICPGCNARAIKWNFDGFDFGSKNEERRYEDENR
ncbi:hypothetical protein K490DRAFT_62573 [Saccharata proteae CBS 121410]|uniref:BTB domain-containing protein n=1 Tax=Saccharata proteae CBS 121410 TaxID=1314787 RepID=A0A9P4I1C6_9PEZI|nr:hypothetical protein K490DRAFT_62573 [Saccharata proteae CBS 121410]